MARLLLIRVFLVAALVVCINAATRCGQNEEWSNCGACDSTCKEQVACAAVCRPGSCACKYGYVRNDNGVCILKENCPKSVCGVNEEIKGCGACDSTCKENRMCTMECRQPECGCIRNHVRDEKNKCVPKSFCPL